jgi:hypothetical protein
MLNATDYSLAFRGVHVYVTQVKKKGSKKKAKPKTVFEFSAGGVVTREGEHDHEIEDVRWLPVEEAIDALSYDSDRKLVETTEAGV